MKNTLNYIGNVGKNTLHTLPAEYVGEKMPWAALCLPSVLSVSAVCRPSVRAAADTAAAMLRRYADVSARLDALSQRAARSVCRALIAKSGLNKSAARGIVWGGKLGGGADAPMGRDNTAPVRAMRQDLTTHFGTMGGTSADGRKWAVTAPYWAKVDTAAADVSAAEAAEVEAEAAAKQYTAAANAAKRAGDVETWKSLTHTAKAWRDTAKTAHAAAVTAGRVLWGLVNDYTMGGGVDLYQIAAAYLWERLAVDGLTADSLVYGTAANGRTSVKTVFQWACILCRRAVRAEGQAMAQTAAGYTYFSDGWNDTNAPESETAERVRRAPKLYDVGSDGDGLTTGESLDRLESLTKSLELSPRQEEILSYRLKGFSRDDISGKMGIARGTLNKQLLRIAEKARNIFPAETLEKYGIK